MAKHTKKEKAVSQPERRSAPQEKSLLLPILIWALCFVAFCNFIIGAYIYTSYQSAQKKAEEQRLYAQSAASQAYTPPTADQIWGTQPPSQSQEAEPDKTDAEAMPPQDLQSQLLAQQTGPVNTPGQTDVTPEALAQSDPPATNTGTPIQSEPSPSATQPEKLPQSQPAPIVSQPVQSNSPQVTQGNGGNREANFASGKVLATTESNNNNDPVYHIKDCRSAQKIQAESELWYESEQAAISDGRRLCGNCKR